METLYIKKINGIEHIKQRHQIVITKNGITYINPQETMILEDGWNVYENHIEKPIENILTIDDVKQQKISELLEYDSSIHVNCFLYDNMQMWLDKATRVGLKLRVEAELLQNKEITSLWYNGFEVKLKTSDAQNMLYQIELYASECYDNTQKHIAVINSLTNIEDIAKYNYTTGYPARLMFTSNIENSNN